MRQRKPEGQLAVKVLISVPDNMLEKVDALASAEGYKRSELIREALREYIRTSQPL